VAVESTCNWYWFVDGLRRQGRHVRLANPAKMDQYSGLKVGNDASDAGWIAEQMRLGILPESYVYPPQVRPIRDALRRRMLIVRQWTQTLLSLESLFARHALGCPRVDELKSWTGVQVDYASYCRTVKSERRSNDKKKGENNRKNGNRVGELQ
jgi:hypothetical protein